jgi:hypothetical protein
MFPQLASLRLLELPCRDNLFSQLREMGLRLKKLNNQMGANSLKDEINDETI